MEYSALVEPPFLLLMPLVSPALDGGNAEVYVALLPLKYLPLRSPWSHLDMLVQVTFIAQLPALLSVPIFTPFYFNVRYEHKLGEDCEGSLFFC